MTHTDEHNQLLLEAALLGVRAKLAQLERDRSILLAEDRRLRAEIRKLEKKADSIPPPEGADQTGKKKSVRKRQLSPEARERIRAAQKRRWAKIREVEVLAKEKAPDTPSIAEAKSNTVIVPVENGQDLIPEEEEPVKKK